ncbi:5-oxoprolinase/urea amidolyase family protein [Sorangium sp. So ce124]|uniref:5-oxoprolinase/urea amidolyase family protein n=1 Tax=Sorangium sp. So ce124 TaxID=3133280 RepID=UPI003F6340B4
MSAMTPPFRRVLVANRGEIACRLLRTLKRLGVASVAVFSDADRAALHVRLADHAVRLGGQTPAESYLRVDAVLDAARRAGADAIHPGYGFLSESDNFARAVEDAGIVFIGPTSGQMEAFGSKHRAREIAVEAGVPLLPGTGVLRDADHAAAEAAAIGYPVLLKASAGGGGIGMARCDGPAELPAAFERVQRLARSNFGSGEVFLERFLAAPRHVEVQIAGDGRGNVLVLGDRDCSVQRRNQKVLEEAPAPDLPPRLRSALAESARALAAKVAYRNVGTVEFLVDPARAEHYFLEVNTRLQVEHGVTELCTGVDLVEWMLRIAAGDTAFFAGGDPALRGHAIEARLYAEDPARGFLPSAGLLTEVRTPEGGGVRVDGWVETGTEVSALYDPLLAKLLVHRADRAAAVAALRGAVEETRIGGIETNREWVAVALDHPDFRGVRHHTGTFAALPFRPPTIEVTASPGAVTVQDWPGRLGLWSVGVPPSGPMDDLSFRLGNRVVGNPGGAAGLECEVHGPTLVFHRRAVVCAAGAAMRVLVDGTEVAPWTPVEVAPGATVACGPVRGPGARAYLLVRGGIDVPAHLGSRATFTLGGFGGHAGRPLRPGDVLRLGEEVDPSLDPGALPPEARPEIGRSWELAVLDGPHGAPDFLTRDGIEQLYEAEWEVHYHSARTGVRLVGPAPRWARTDGGEAGLHPSNLHDNAYGIGAVDLTGDMPVLLGPDGPSLGGFVCPLTVAAAERWKLGQLSAGDKVRFRSIVPAEADALAQRCDALVALRGGASKEAPAPLAARANGATTVANGGNGATTVANGATTVAARAAPAPAPLAAPAPAAPRRPRGEPVLGRVPARDDRPAVVFRQSGDRYVLVEFGPPVLDIDLRVRAHLLMARLEELRIPGVIDLTPGIRSLQVHVDGARLTVAKALDLLREVEADLPAQDEVRIPSRVVHMPLSWDDPATREAIERYMRAVRDDAPWCPSNLEFIRRVNGLPDIAAVQEIFLAASYLVLGLGDVYLGAPVATPIDPRHRMVTTKYNPARTWTPENAVGIGGAYLCIYGMEGPGGYQFLGRTVPVWSRHRPFRQTTRERPWLLRFFDQLRFHLVSADELLDLRADMVAGRGEVRIEETTFDLGEHHRFLAENAGAIRAAQARQRAAFDAERARWEADGEFDRVRRAGARLEGAPTAAEDALPAGVQPVTAPLTACVWKVDVAEGQRVEAGQRVAVLEAMKMEFPVVADVAGAVGWIGCRPGQMVSAGQPLVGVSADA